MVERVVVLAAHPDDETIGAGATLARWRAEGSDVFVWFATDGTSSRDQLLESATDRRRRAERALAILGVRDVRFLEFPDNALDSIPRLEIAKAMESFITDLSPTRILTHSQADLNIDHKIVGECAAIVARPIPDKSLCSVWHFEIPSSTGWFGDAPKGFHPTHFIDVEQYLHLKISALSEYGAEIPAWPHARSSQALQALAHYRGSQSGCAAAEAFSVSFARS